MNICSIINKPVYFTQKINLIKHNQKLIEYEKNDFISGIYYTDLMNQDKTKFKDYKVNIYFNNPNLKDYDSPLFDSNPNDAPYKFAAIVKKLNRLKKDTVICNSIPNIFNGLNQNKLVQELDILSNIIREDYQKLSKDSNTIQIAGKNININYLGKGENSLVFKLDDGKNTPVVMKTYIKPEEVSTVSIWGEMAIYQEIKNDKINNIPELYIANPISTKVEDKTKEYTELFDIDDLKDFDGYKGAWSIVEYIEKDTPVKKEGISFLKWLKDHNLYHIDLTCDNCIGSYITDLGGIST